MSDERTVIENLGRRRLVREYGPDGALRILRLEPTPPAVAPVPARAAPPTPIPPVPPAHTAPPQPRPAERPAPESLPVELEAYEPAPTPVASETPPDAEPPSPSPLAAALDAATATLQEPARFVVLAAEPIVEPAPVPAPAASPAPPATAAPLRVTTPRTRRIALPPPPAPEELPVELEPYVEETPVPAPPPAPRALATSVPDLERRVDDLLARKPRVAPKRRARTPLEVPTFAPLTRSAWEDRLDAVLRERAH